MNTGNLWNKQEELQLMDEISDKKTVEEIAKSHGRTSKAIEMRIESLIRKQYQNKYTINALMTLYNKSEQDIKKIIQEIPQKKEFKKPGEQDDRIQKLEERLERIEKYLIKIYKKIC